MGAGGAGTTRAIAFAAWGWCWVFFSGEGVAGADAGTGAYCANAVSGVVKFPNPLAIGSESDIHGSWGT